MELIELTFGTTTIIMEAWRYGAIILWFRFALVCAFCGVAGHFFYKWLMAPEKGHKKSAQSTANRLNA